MVSNEMRPPIEMGHKGKEEPNDKEIKQLQRSLNEQVLEGATADPQWRQRFIEDPEMLRPSSRKSRGSGRRTKSNHCLIAMPAQKEDLVQLNRSFWEKVLERQQVTPSGNSSSSTTREATLNAYDFPELKRVEELQQSADYSGKAKVAGHLIPGTSQVMTNPY
ncbi:MAG: hypothetical protein JOZ19_10310 [Rubrobacter sp.]|nr:hypothetical protein [Rubrobacter sp.]